MHRHIAMPLLRHGHMARTPGKGPEPGCCFTAVALTNVKLDSVRSCKMPHHTQQICLSCGITDWDQVQTSLQVTWHLPASESLYRSKPHLAVMHGLASQLTELTILSCTPSSRQAQYT
jgi:hypothetical protein